MFLSRGKRIIHRVTAMILAVCMLPFGYYSEALAYGNTDNGVELTVDEQEETTSGNDMKRSFLQSEIDLTNTGEYEDYTIQDEEVVLSEDIKVANLIINGGKLDLNGYTLSVYGEVIQSAGEVILNGGSLLIGQDYLIQSRKAAGTSENEENLYEYSVSTGSLIMNNTADHVLVCGNFIMDSNKDHTEMLTGGTLECRGNFTQLATECDVNFVARQEHKVLFSGSKMQEVNFASNNTNTKSRFANLEIINGIDSSSQETVSGQGMDDNAVVFNNAPYVSGNVSSSPERKVIGQIAVDSNTVFPTGYFGGGLYTLSYINFLNNLELGDSSYFNYNTNIYGELKIHGDLQMDSTLIMQQGKLYIDGDFKYKEKNYVYGIYMQHAEDYILVKGNFYHNLYRAGVLQAGLLEIQGDAEFDGIQASGSHKIILSGDKKQTITLADNSYLNIVELKNYSVEGIYSNKPLTVKKLVRNGCNILYGSIKGEYGYTLTKDEVIDGDFVLIEDTLNLNGYNLTINGDLIQSGGEVFVNGGKLQVKGDYRMQSYTGEGEGIQYGISSGSLIMQKEADYVYIGGSFYISSNADSAGLLTNGIIEIKGDFKKDKILSASNFVATENHTILLSGTQKQTVEFADSDLTTSRLANIEIQNNSLEGTEFLNKICITGLVTDYGNKVSGTIGITNTTRFGGNSFGGGIFTLQDIDMNYPVTIRGDFVVNKKLNIYNTLAVKGNVEITYGGIYLQEGRLEVGGNFAVNNVYTYGLQMTHDKDFVSVSGDFLYAPWNNAALSMGTLELKGNIDIRNYFFAASPHKTILSGDKKQIISMSDGLYFGILELQNYSEDGVYSENALRKDQLIRNGCKLSYAQVEGIYGYTLSEDEVITGDLLLLEDTLDLNGHNLTVEGNLIQSGGEVYINGGSLTIKEDYHIESVKTVNEQTQYGVSTGFLRMDNDADIVLVKGDFYVNSTASTTGKLINGVLEVEGDLTQKKTSNTSSFQPSGSHTLRFSGSKKQTVSFETSSATTSQIANMEITNTSEDGIEFTAGLYVAGKISAGREHNISGEISIGTNTTFTTGYFGGSILVLSTYNVKEDLELGGDLRHKANINIYEKLVVGGNVATEQYLLSMQKGRLEIKRDYITKTNTYGYGISMTNEEDYILVGGNFSFAPYYYNSRFTAGTLEIQGDIKIEGGFQAAGTHRTLLSGDQKQTVSIAAISYFNILELQNYSNDGVYSDTPLPKSQIIRNGCKLTYGSLEGEYGYQLTEDTVINGDFILIDDVLDLNGHTLTIQGNLVQAGGEVFVNGGKLHVEGDYRQQSETKELLATTVTTGSGVLRMDTAGDFVLVKGDMIVNSTVTGSLTNGVLEVKGDLVQNKTNNTSSFRPSGSHIVRFSGSNKQTVSFETSSATTSQIANMEITNTSEEGIVFEASPYVAGKISAGRGHNISGEISIGTNTTFTTGYFGGSIYVLNTYNVKEDLEIGGDLRQKANINIYEKLVVGGNVATEQYLLSMQKGRLEIKGDYITKTNTYGYGISMTNEEDYILVGGKFSFAPYYYNSRFTAGTLEIQGDIKIEGGFQAAGTHRTLLSGDQKQTVSIAAISYFNILELQNYSNDGVYSDTPLPKSQIIRNGCKLTYGSLEGEYGYQLTEDTVINGDFILIDDVLDLNGHTLTIQGDLVQVGGEVYVNGGKLYVEGDYRQQSEVKELFTTAVTAGSGFLRMDTADDFVLVKGDMIVNSTVTGSLTNGVLEVQGDLVQKKTSNTSNFRASGSHTVRLSGSKKQTVSFETSSATTSQIANMEITNTSEEGIAFTAGPYVAGKISAGREHNIAGEISIGTNTTFTTGYFGGSIYVLSTYNVKEDLEVGGDLRQKANINIYEKLVVGGNVVSETYLLTMQKGRLEIKGDYISKTNTYGSGISMTNEEDSILVEGNFLYAPYYQNNFRFTAGTLEIKGDAKIDKGFQATGTHRTLLSGDKKQTVTIADDCYFNILELQNYSKDGIYSDTPLPKSQLIRNGCKLTYGSLNGVCGFTLQEDYIADGDFILTDDTLNLNGHTLTVRGNFIQSGGKVELNGGTLIVDGDFRQQMLKVVRGETVYTESKGVLVMEDEKEQVIVNGNFIIQPAQKMDGNFKNGTLKVSGNFTQLGSYGFAAEKNHTLLLNGSETQTVTCNGESVIGNVVIENTGRNGAVLASKITVLGTISDLNQRASGSGGLVIESLAQVTGKKFGGNLTITKDNTLTENIIIGGSLTINADTELKLNCFQIQCKNINIYGSLAIENGEINASGNLNVYPSGIFTMIEPAGYAFINGNVSFAAKASHQGLLTEGILEVRGNFTQSNTANFIATEEHTTILSKKQAEIGKSTIQTITFQHPGTARFHKLVLKKNLKTGYVFSAAPETLADEVVYEVTDDILPAPVEAITVNQITATSVQFSFTAPKDATGIIGYEIYRNGKKAAFISQTEYRDTNLTPDADFTYQVYTMDRNQNRSETAASIQVKTLKDEAAPDKVIDFSIEKRSGSAISLKWSKPSDNVGVASYNLYRNGELVKANLNALSFKDTELIENKVYTYYIIAKDAAGNESESSEEIVTAVAAPKITKVTPEDYTTIGGESVELCAYFRNSGNSTGNKLKIEYFDETDGEYVEITPTLLGQKDFNTSTLYASYRFDITKWDADVALDIRYTLYDEDNNSTQEEVTYLIDRTAPKPPTKFAAEQDDGCVKLTWSPSISSDCQRYQLYRGVDGEGSYEKIAVIEGGKTAWYTDSQVQEGQTYTYMLRAGDQFDQFSVLSDSVSICVQRDMQVPEVTSILPDADAIGVYSKITVQAEDNKELKAIRLSYRKEAMIGEGEEEWILISEKETSKIAEFDLPYEDMEEAVYELCAIAVDQSGNESREFVATYKLDKTGIQKIGWKQCDADTNSVYLRWKEITEEDFSYFLIEQKQADGTYVEIGREEKVLGYIVKGLKENTAYTFRVTGYDLVGNKGIPSDDITLTTKTDTICPVIARVEPAESRFKDIINLNAVVQDNASVEKVIFSYSLDKEQYTEIQTVTATEKNTQVKLGAKFDTTALPEGKVYVKFEAYDSAGNKNALTSSGEEIIAEYIIDRTAPAKVNDLKVTGNDGYIGLEWLPGQDEDLKNYRIFRANEEDGIFRVLAAECNTKNYYDRNVELNQSYLYKVAAIDVAGNIGEYSEIVAGTVIPDETAPEIRGFAPKSGDTLGSNPKIKVVASDNTAIKNITVEYRDLNDEDSIWSALGQYEGKEELAYLETVWNTDGLAESTYEVRVTAQDTSGNISETMKREFTLDLTAPEQAVLTTETAGYAVKLNYTENTEEDFSHYQIYRRGLEEKEYQFLYETKENNYVDEVEPNTLYFYQIRAFDSHGNCSTSKGISGYANDVDEVAPTAVLPENLIGMAGREIAFDGTASSDNVKIRRYKWNMGDGTTLTGPQPVHIYEKPGTYTVTLTVTDTAGLQDSATANVIVLDESNKGNLKVQFKDRQGNAIPYTNFYLKKSEKESLSLQADAQGTLELAEEIGIYEYGAYQVGYLPQEGKVHFKEFNQAAETLVITLESGELMFGEVKVRKLELAELIANGVDLSDPDNYHTFEFRVDIALALTALPKEYIQMSLPEFNLELKTKELVEEEKDPTGSYTKREGGFLISWIKPEEDIEEEPPVLAYVSVQQSISWLKDMYGVELGIINNAESGFDIKDAKATLSLPNGLSLASTSKQQKYVQDMKTISGKSKEKAAWVIRGDKSGQYNLEIGFSGNLSPFNVPLKKTFKTEKEFDVKTGEGIEILVMPEQSAYIGEDYYVQFCIKNNSDRTLYGFKTDLSDYTSPQQKSKVFVKDIVTGETVKVIEETYGTTYIVPNANECRQLPVITNGDIINIGVFSPGDTLYGTYRTPFSATGDPEEEYYVFYDAVVTALQGANLGVDVKVKPISSHINMSIVNVPPLYTLFADPVDTASGAFTEEITPINVTGATTISADFTYNSMMSEEAGEMGKGWYHGYENKIVNEGSMLKFYSTPSQSAVFMHEDALNQIAYGTMAGDDVVLDQKEYYGKFLSYSGGLSGYYIERTESGYTLFAKNKDQFKFNNEGKLTSILSAEGKKVNFSYKDNQMTVQEPVSKCELIYTYNEDGLLIEISDHTGRTASLAYNDSKLLKKITFPDGAERKFTYNNEGLLEAEIDAKGVTFVKNTYDDEKRVISQSEVGRNDDTKFQYNDETRENTITDHNGNVMTVETDSRGNVVRTVNPNGSETTITYDKNGQTLNERDHYGQTVSYQYDLDGNVIGVYDTSNNKTFYLYDSKGNVIKAISQTGAETTFTYDSKGQMTSQTDPLGTKTTYTYDSKGNLAAETVEGLGTKTYEYTKGRLTSQTDYNDNETTYEYDEVGNIIKTTMASGEVNTYTYDSCSRLLKVVTTIGDQTYTVTHTYDKNGNKTSSTDQAGNKTSFEYDQAGRICKETDPEGYVTTYQYDDMGNLLQTTYPGDIKEKCAYDAAGNIISRTHPDNITYTYEYDMLGNKTKQISPTGVEVRFEYYPNGKLYKEKYPDGQTTLYTYDTNWNLVRVTDNEGNTKSYEYDAAGHVLEERNALGHTIKNTYDKYGRMLTTKDSNGNTTKYEYDANGNCIKQTDPLGTATHFVYDDLNRLTEMYVNIEGKKLSRTYAYDTRGMLEFETDEEGNKTRFTYDAFGNIKTVINPNNRVAQTYEYDKINRVTSVKDALSNETTYTYDSAGRLAEVAEVINNSNKITTKYSIDKNARLTQSIDPEQGVSKYTYDKMDNILSQTDPNGGTTTYTYNNMCKVLTETSPIGNVTSYEYNSLGLLAERKNANNQKTSYTYDKIGRIVKVKDNEGTIQYTYDNNGNILTTTDSKGTISREYDQLNRVTQCTDYNGNTVKYSYDQIGNMIQLTYPGGEIVRYTYYKNGWLNSVLDNKNRATIYNYDKNGNLMKTQNPDGTIELRGYNFNNQVTSIRTTKDANVINEFTYTYDARGNITNLKTANQQKNLSSLNNAVMTYDKDNRLLTYNGENVTYDAEGNMTYGPLNGIMTAMKYDCRNQLVRAGQTTYEYDAEGNRISLTEKDYKYTYILDRDSTLTQVLQTQTYTKNVLGFYTNLKDQTTYYYGNGLIAQEDQTNNYLTYHFDHLGSTQSVTDINGVIKAEYDYGTYGELLTQNTLGLSYLYNGKFGVQTDQNGLYYMRARYYNTDIKRFINKDILVGEISQSQSLNRYSYVQGNPVNYADPFGLSPEQADGKGSGSTLTPWGRNILNVIDTLGFLGNFIPGFSPFTLASQAFNVISSIGGHNLLDALGFIPGIGDVADIINGVWYMLEGNSFMAATSFLAALPFVGSVLGTGAKLCFKGTKYVAAATKAAQYLKLTTRIISNTANFTMSAINLYYSISDAKGEYDSNNGKLSTGTILNVALNAGMTIISGAGALQSGNAMRKMLEADGVGSKLARVRNAGSARVATAKCTVLTKFTGEPRCFTAGTLVQTEDGTKPIEEIQVGDIVLATDPITLQTSYQEVTLLHISETEELIHVTIEIEDGEESKEEVIEATPSHPFYVKGADFIRADSLKEGDELRSETGLRVTVKKLEYEKLDEPVKVYNLTISGDHTYYVGSVGVLVHNTGGCDVGSGSETKTGGAYKSVAANGGQVHHMPADSVSPYSKRNGPGIRMDTKDHMDTASWGSSKVAKAYRKKQKELIDKGMFREAQQMDILDVQSKFGSKYDSAIQEMLDYTEELLN